MPDIRNSEPVSGHSEDLGFDFVRSHNFFGAHKTQIFQMDGCLFRVWAPHARAVCVMGSFNGWNAHQFSMKPVGYGIWELFLPGLRDRTVYQYSIHTNSGAVYSRADPYAYYTQQLPETGSRIYDHGDYPWRDDGWNEFRANRNWPCAPINIYRLHLASWRRTEVGKLLTYDGIAKWLIPYVKQMGYTHVLLADLMEHQDDRPGASPSGFFAPNSRFGDPKDLKWLVNLCHQSGIGVLMDWSPVPFPIGIGGLDFFDGHPCYEAASTPSRFDWGRDFVRSFLFSSALFWLEEYHLDGFALSRIGEMTETDKSAVSFLEDWNKMLHRESPGVLTIADQGDCPISMTGPDSLGFDLALDTQWRESALSYQALDPIYRQFHHENITSHVLSQTGEHRVLPFSRIESSLVSLFPGDDEDKFSGMRAYYLYCLFCPGKKLSMMGSELGQFANWNPDQSLDWHLLRYEPFRRYQLFVRGANEFYLTQAPLWQRDHLNDGFQWLCDNDRGGNLLTCLRRDNAGNELMLAVNFSRLYRKNCLLGVPQAGTYRVVFSTDNPAWGPGQSKTGTCISVSTGCHGMNQSISLDLPPLSAVVLRQQNDEAI